MWNLHASWQRYFVYLTILLLCTSPGCRKSSSRKVVPQISIQNAINLNEGDGGNTNAVLSITLSSATSVPVSVNYTTQNGTAQAGRDYQSTSGTLTIPAGQTSTSISVTIIGDDIPENDEIFYIKLSSPVNGTLGNSQATVTIQNDDPLPSISIADIEGNEGDHDSTDFVFTVSLSTICNYPVIFDFDVVEGTATHPDDFFAQGGIAFSVPTGSLTRQFSVTVFGDTLAEEDETFFVVLSNPRIGVDEGWEELLPDMVFIKNQATATILSEEKRYYVSKNGNDSNNGRTWGQAFQTIQKALTEATANDEIWVSGGTYKPTQTNDPTVAFILKEGVKLYGGFAGTETTIEQRDTEENETILSGDIGIINDITDNSYHVVIGASGSVLSGFTITGGNARDGVTPFGGGLFNDQITDMIIESCSFFSNYAEYGGAIFNIQCDNIQIIDSNFYWNQANLGGAITNDSSDNIEITGCYFISNQTDSEIGSGRGGAIANQGLSTITITDTLFSDNKAHNGGGAIFNDNSTLDIQSSTFSHNQIIRILDSLYGGAIVNTGGDATLTLKNSDLSNNYSPYGGGAIANTSSGRIASIENCIFENNTAYSEPNGWGYGGAIVNLSSIIDEIRNSQFTGNFAKFGGAVRIWLGMSSLRVINCSFKDNEAEESGGAILVVLGTIDLINCLLTDNVATTHGSVLVAYDATLRILNVTATENETGHIIGFLDVLPLQVNGHGTFTFVNCSQVLMINSILWNNIPGNSSLVIYNQGSSPSISNSCIQSCGGSGGDWNGILGTDGGGNIEDDPLFINPSIENYRLSESSPCIDTGNELPFNSGGMAEDIDTDLDGNLRIIGDTIDMGAYESEFDPD